MKLVLCLMLFAMAGTATGNVLVVSGGDITGDVTWSAADDTVKLTGDVRVRNGHTLVIEAGTHVRGYQANLTDLTPRHIFTSADGAIQVNGTPENNVQFYTIRLEWDGLTRDADNWVKGATMQSAWGHGLCEFRNESGSSEVSHVLFEDLNMPNCGSEGFYITSGGSPTIRNSVFQGGRCGLWAHGGGQMVVENCIFNNHTTTAIISGGMGGPTNPASYEPMSCYIDHCVFNNIQESGSISGVPVATGYAICTVNYPGTLSVTNSIFHTIARSAIRDWNIEDTNFPENWVVTTDYNSYYYVEDDPVRLLPTGSHSIVNQNPLMTDPDNADVSLQTGSPCLNAASDGTNIGVWQSGTSVDDISLLGSFSSGLGAMTNPFRGAVSFNFDSYGGARLSIYNAQGQRVNSMVVQNGKVEWDGTDMNGNELAPGLYYYNLNADNLRTLKTIVKMD